MADAEQVELAAEAYIYGYPLVYDLEEVVNGVEGGGSLPIQAPYNRFAYARRLLGPETKFVSPNNDTLYAVGQCDVRQGPLVLHVPDTHDRYYVLQFIDAWTNNFAYIGRRATGTAEAEYLLTDRDYNGPVPDGMTVVDAPTGVFTIGGRVQVDGAADLPAVHALQDQFTLTPLSVHQGDAAPPDAAGVPQPDPRVGEELGWWERFRVALAAFPPPPGDAPFLALAERFGATAAESPYVHPDPGLAEVLIAGQQAGQAKIEELAKAARTRRAAGTVPCTCSTTTWTTWAWAPSMRPNGRSLTARRPTWRGQWRRAPGCGATTAMRPTTPSSGPTATANPWTAPTATSCGWSSSHRWMPFGR